MHKGKEMVRNAQEVRNLGAHKEMVREKGA